MVGKCGTSGHTCEFPTLSVSGFGTNERVDLLLLSDPGRDPNLPAVFNQSSSSNPAGPDDFGQNTNLMRPLEKRSRPAPIVSELEDLSARSRAAVLKRVKDKQKGLQRETLVSLARTFHQREDTEAVGIVLSALIARVSGVLRQKLQAWHVPAADKEDIQRHLIAGLCGYWLDTKAGEELWECNFTTPFQLRTLTLIESFFAKKLRTTSLSAVYDDGEESGTEKDIADPASEAPFIEIRENMPEREALRALTRHNAVWARVLYDKYFAEYSEEEIAARHGVTSRTIRNWIKEAKLFLQAQVAETQSEKENARVRKENA